MKKSLLTIGAGLALCMMTSPAQAVGLPGAHNYKLVLRNQFGFAIGYEGDSVSDYYTFEVYNAAGERINIQASTSADFTFSNTVGFNYRLSVCTFSDTENPQSGYAVPGEQLTLVVKSGGSEIFRSSKILPPVEWGGISTVPVGVFYSDSGDTDRVYDSWAETVDSWYDAYFGGSIGGRNDDCDGDGLTNMREYQFGTDPAGDLLGLVDKPEVSITEEANGVIRVSFNYGWGHVYSVRAIEGTEPVGKDGQDLALYESLANLNAGTSCGQYLYDSENSGTKTYYVKTPDISGTHLIGLAVDGQLLEYITVGQQQSAVEVTPGSPIEYDTEAAATTAQAIAEVTPSAAVAAVLTGAGAEDGYKAKFTVEVQQANEKWLLSAQLTPEAWTNLVENAASATRQIPVAEIAALPMNATTNVVLTGCMAGFYYSLYSGASVTNITADAEAENLNVLCGADGVVEFPKVKKPSEGAGFFFVGPKTYESAVPGGTQVWQPL